MTLSEKAQEVRRQYHREWQRSNPEKVKRNQLNYWERKAQRNNSNDNSRP